MTVDEFWQLIDKSVSESRGDPQKQIVFLESILVEMDDNHIFDFEEILRKKIIECDDFGIMAAAKIIDGYVSDDSYLYFRCWLIARGKTIFEQALEAPDSLADCLTDNECPDLEALLCVATHAYSEKTGREEDETFPRDMCIGKGLDYNFAAPPTKGKDWTESDLPEMLPKLWKLFNR